MSRSQAREAVVEPFAPPRGNPDLLGHDAAEAELRRLFDSGRMPHALLLSGPRGIGKATLAFRLARFVLAQGGEPAAGPSLFGEDSGGGEDPGSTGLAIPPESGTFRRVASGGHADLLRSEEPAAGPSLFGEDSGGGEDPGSTGLAIPPESGTFRRVASGGHADLL